MPIVPSGFPVMELCPQVETIPILAAPVGSSPHATEEIPKVDEIKAGELAPLPIKSVWTEDLRIPLNQYPALIVEFCGVGQIMKVCPID